MPAAARLFAEISPYSLQLVIVEGRRLVACEDFPLHANAALAGFLAKYPTEELSLALVSPAESFAHLSAEESARVRSPVDLEAYAETLPTGLPSPLAAIVCDAASGKAVDPAGASPWLMVGTTTENLASAVERLEAAGLAMALRGGLALPAQIGAVVETLQDMPESARVAVLALGETGSVLALVSAGGVEAVRSVETGYGRIFEGVQAALGLKFRSAASKLFFNTAYDFGETAAKIAAGLADDLRPALETLGAAPTALHCVGVHGGQAWFTQALAESLRLSSWSPDVAAASAHLGLEASDGNVLPASALGLLRLALDEGGSPSWLPAWLGAEDASVEATEIAEPAPEPPVARPSAPAAGAKAPASTRTVGKPRAGGLAPPAKRAGVPAKALHQPTFLAKPTVRPAGFSQKTVPPFASLPAPVAPVVPGGPKKFPVIPLVASLAIALIATGAFLFFGHKRAVKTHGPTVRAEAPVAKADAPVVKPPVKADAVAVKADAPTAKTVAPAAEVSGDTHGFQNENYHFKISDKGVLVDLARQGQSDPLIRRFGFLRLFTLLPQADGQTSLYPAGDINDAASRVSVVKKVADGAVVFEVAVQHPKFDLKETITCLPRSVKVEAVFTSAPRTLVIGLLNAAYEIQLNEAALASRQVDPQAKPGELVYGMTGGALALRYSSSTHAAIRPIVSDPALAYFVMATAKDQKPRQLTCVIELP